ncbi:uncharacterized protein LOC110022713 [Phalaenopsis equestris]|uniref:uncharacterized protein LOC110022713 n=1 Tax=Phalaenopsis equestris TaxID=78828 RepID=UPI0009E3064F|nr:uncharacterized protein LOC110022713 [Phalaenopsis equestris]
MAVQAQYPANFLLHRRGETERSNKEMEANLPPPLLEQSLAYFSSNEGNVNLRKRGRESAMAAPVAVASPQQQNTSVFSMQAPQRVFTHSLLGVAQLQPSTSLRLAFKDQNQSQNQRKQTDSILSLFSKELATEINQQKLEIEQLLITQGEQLRREIADKRQHHYQMLLASVEKLFGDKLREKEAEVQLAARRTAELQDRLAHLRTESMAWQAKAIAEQTAASPAAAGGRGCSARGRGVLRGVIRRGCGVGLRRPGPV